MSKGSTLMKSAQNEKTKQTIEQLVEWYSTKEEFYKAYLPIQQSIAKRLLATTEITINRLKDIAQIFKDERDIQALIYQKSEKNTLSNQAAFHPKVQEVVDPKGVKTKVEQPVWSSNIDRIFVSLGIYQKTKQSQIKKIYKLLEGIEQSIGKEEVRYKNEIKKSQKQLQGLFNKIDQSETEASKIMGKLIKESKNQPLKQSDFFIGELKKLECNLLNEIGFFAERNKKLLELIQSIINLEKEVAKKVKEEMNSFLSYRKSFLGIDTKEDEEIWGLVALCQEKIEVERVSYFNKMLLKGERIEELKRLMAGFEAKNNWQVIIKFLQTPKEVLAEAIKVQKSMAQMFKNISYRCWTKIFLAQGWLIQSYTPSVMYMTYDHIMIIYNQEGQCLKKIHTSSSKISKVEGNTIFLKEKIKGFFSDSLEEYKIRFEDIERMEEFQLFMENQIN